MIAPYTIKGWQVRPVYCSGAGYLLFPVVGYGQPLTKDGWVGGRWTYPAMSEFVCGQTEEEVIQLGRQWADKRASYEEVKARAIQGW